MRPDVDCGARQAQGRQAAEREAAGLGPPEGAADAREGVRRGCFDSRTRAGDRVKVRTRHLKPKDSLNHRGTETQRIRNQEIFTTKARRTRGDFVVARFARSNLLRVLRVLRAFVVKSYFVLCVSVSLC